MYRAVGLWLLMAVSGIAQSADPTRPAGVVLEENRATILTLDSLLIGEQRQIAVINGRALRVGERIGNAEVIAIGPAGVQLQRQGKRVTLTPQRQTIKRKAE